MSSVVLHRKAVVSNSISCTRFKPEILLAWWTSIRIIFSAFEMLWEPLSGTRCSNSARCTSLGTDTSLTSEPMKHPPRECGFPGSVQPLAFLGNQLATVPDVYDGAEHFAKNTKRFLLAELFVEVSSAGLRTIHCCKLDRVEIKSIVARQLVSVSPTDPFVGLTKSPRNHNLVLQHFDLFELGQ